MACNPRISGWDVIPLLRRPKVLVAQVNQWMESCGNFTANFEQQRHGLSKGSIGPKIGNTHEAFLHHAHLAMLFKNFFQNSFSRQKIDRIQHTSAKLMSSCTFATKPCSLSLSCSQDGSQISLTDWCNFQSLSGSTQPEWPLFEEFLQCRGLTTFSNFPRLGKALQVSGLAHLEDTTSGSSSSRMLS